MLVSLIEWFQDRLGDFPGADLFDFLSVRAGAAIIISLLISMVFGAGIIRKLQRHQMGESVRDLGLEGQAKKAGTPTMGGIIILLAILVPCLLMGRLDNVYLLTMLVTTVWMGLIGFVDDYLKIKRKNKDGLAGRFKILGQVGLGLTIALVMLFSEQVVARFEVADAASIGLTDADRVGPIATTTLENGVTVSRANYRTTVTNVPFVKDSRMAYENLFGIGKQLVWILFIPFIIFIVTAISNAANLTDGLDGLATGVSATIAGTLAVFAYVSSNAIAANYLGILHLPGTEELVVFSGCLLGACLGFLWYNSFPATVFMGDTGSLALGGIIAALAILLRKELLLPMLCIIFVVENLSVVVQVSYFKYTKRKYGEGRRIFLMSPLHHHFQKKGMPETKIVIRFWIVSLLLAVATILTLKLR
ncbi:phospho-N-acetylmuramoyl-pentapeptide-transferase [Neolewinella lacunae]|uniref:Phospho-N-acetylmuramoyl-pentapeptide-transferase n=1 Tax=Neolewinella lacunae TaxID=1517758 RepID=A0A923PI54_9BACT|nr:phospho-N-acetylmuramoyl-pentapeptide-transferase [Neolewinella lacunae]MBC6994515.1 phospho-N-acetylmuramoyl-pentapeptide-transferase [Neolewinella lacunae]MDN3634208.1 phospho-N-acetylmuramoyl-pentapeptide-transferase [Neolewinella lacunae]